MPLVNMHEPLRDARKGGYAVGAFNPFNYDSAQAIVEAADDLKSPVILQTSEKTVRYWGHKRLYDWVNGLANETSVPVTLHLDHGKDLNLIRACIEAGWTSVMIDASDKPFDENLAITREVVAAASAKGVGVEAELGEIGGVEEDIVVAEEDAHLADPIKSQRFCEAVDLAVFAPAIGTAHGYYHGEAKVAFDLIEEIFSRTQVPLALHGGTGLSDEVFKRCMRLGCAKINISTNLKHCFVEGFERYRQANANVYEPLTIMRAQYETMKSMVKERIIQFGSEGKGA